MEEGRGVRRRREERIRSILEEESARERNRRLAESAVQRPLAGPGGDRPGGGRAYPDEPPATHNRDPEAEWKRSANWHRTDRPRLNGFLLRLAAAFCLFGTVWGLFQIDIPAAEPVKLYVLRALTEEMDTAAVAEWYSSTFSGAPSFIPIFHQEKQGTLRVDGSVRLELAAPVSGGAVVRTFAETLSGVEIAGRPGAPVGAMETGRVSQVSGNDEGGYSVVIQHAAGRVSIYGRLSSASVETGDWVEAGDRIGTMAVTAEGEPALLYFAVKTDGRYVDPTDVITLD